MPGTMEVGEAHAGPPRAEHPVIHPTSNCQHPQCDGPTAQADHAQVVLHLQLHYQQAEGGDTQGQQDEGIHNLAISCNKGCWKKTLFCPPFSTLFHSLVTYRLDKAKHVEMRDNTMQRNLNFLLPSGSVSQLRGNACLGYQRAKPAMMTHRMAISSSNWKVQRKSLVNQKDLT